jgi:hypothetical protein
MIPATIRIAPVTTLAVTLSRLLKNRALKKTEKSDVVPRSGTTIETSP